MVGSRRTSRARRAAAVLLAVLLVPLAIIATPPASVAAADGDVDTSYGTGGLASLGFAEGIVPTPYSEWDSALDAAGNFYVVGATSGSPSQAIVVKYDSTGRLDRSFGGAGFVTHDLAGGRPLAPKSIATQEDGDILIGGEVTWTDGRPRVWASRLNPDGSVDAAFGNGFAMYDLSGGTWTGGGEIDVMETDGGALTYLGGWQEGNNDIFVARLTPSGELDTSFGGDGIGVLPMTGVRSVIYDLDLGGDGSVFVATEDRTSTGSGVGKLTYAGMPDTAFDGDGVYHLAGGGWARAIDVSTSGVAIGHWNNTAARVTVIDEVTGATVSSFSGTDVGLFGIAGADLRSIRWDITNDQVVAIGGTGSGRAVVARVDPATGTAVGNTPLPACGGGVGGQTAEVFGGSTTVATGCAGNSIATARVVAGGALDGTWATDGFDDGMYPQRAVVAADAAVLPDGSTVVVGSQTLADTDNSIFITKFTNSGDIDPAFNNGLGWRQISLPTGTLNATSIAVEPGSGNLAVAGFGDVAPLTGESRAFVLLLDRDGLDLVSVDGPFVPIDFAGAEPQSAQATDVAFDADGNVVVGGQVGVGDLRDIAVTRLVVTAGETVAVTPDPGFSGDGVAMVEIGGTADYGFGLTVHPDGGLLVLGATPAIEGPSGYDSVVVRLAADGSPDLAFGSNGIAVVAQNDVSDDFAVAADVATDGTIGVAWYEDIEGATPGVLMLDGGGLPLSGFGVNGSHAFSWAGGSGGAVSDIEFDSSGRALVTGYPAASSTLQVARFMAAGADPTDTGFAGDGLAEVSCAGGDAVGVGRSADGSIYVGGGCGDDVAVAKFTTDPVIANLSLTVTPNPGELVNLDIPLDSVDRSQVMPNAETLAESPWRASPWRASPWRASPWRASPWRASPWRASPWRASPWRASPWRASPIPMVLAQSPLYHEAYPGGWQQLLDTHTASEMTQFRGRLAQNVTFQELPDAAFDNPLITMDHIDFTNSAFGELSLGALLYGRTPLAGVDPNRDWCGLLVDQPVGCASASSGAVDPITTTIAELEFAGVDRRVLWGQELVLRAPGLHPESPLATMPINAFDLDAMTAGRIVASKAGALVGCALGTEGCEFSLLSEAQAAGKVRAEATLVDLLDLIASGDGWLDPIGTSLVSSITLGELLVALIPTEEFPFDQVPLDQLLALQESAPATTFTTTFDLECSQTGDFSVDLELPIGVNGPAQAIIEVGELDTDYVDIAPWAVSPEGPVHWQASYGGSEGGGDLCIGGTVPVVVTMTAPGDLTDGAYDATAVVTAGTTSARVSDVVDDSVEADEVTSGPGDVNNNDPGTAGALVRDRIVSGYISSADDVDYFRVAAGSLPVGSRVTAILSHIPEGNDFDLGIFGDGDELDPANGTIENSPWRASPWRASPWRASPVEDGGLLTTEANNLVPETLQDVPWRASELENAPWRASSINRGSQTEVATTLITERDVAEGRVLTLQVSGYDGSSADLPYILRLKVDEADGDLPCITRPYPDRAAGTALPDLPATTGDPVDTLILVNQERFSRVYGAAAADLRPKLDLLAGNSTVAGLVIPVDGAPAVNAAYDAWDDNPCSIQAANDVVGAINQLVDSYKARLTSLKNIVLVGDDELIPFARVPDQTTLANQIEYRRDAAFNGFDNPISRAFGRNQVLTDDPYGDFDPAPFVGGTLYLPDVAIGRLVETPQQIIDAVDRYVASDGVLDPTTSYTAGYDFLKDMAAEVERNLRTIGATGPQSRIDDSWTGVDMTDALSTSPGIASINAHYNHYGALPAAGLPAVTTAQVNSPLTNSLLFTIGCNAGLPVNDFVAMVGAPQTAPNPKAKDWAQTVSGLGGSFAANTGFGIGDTEAIVLSERLFVNFSSLLASKTMTIGQAFAQAKQQYFAALGVIGVYDAKISQQATFYGLPMARLRGVASAPAFMPDAGPGADASSVTAFEITPTFVQEPTTRGSFWTADGSDVQATHYRPIQPRVQIPVMSQAGQRAHGVIIEQLASNDIGNVDPIYSMPTRDNGAVEPEPVVDEVFFPSTFTNLTYTRVPGETSEQLVLIPGQFFTPDGSSTGGRGTQRLFTRMAGKVLHSNSTDFVAPEMRIFDAIESGATVAFSVDAADPSPSGTVERVLVLYRDSVDPTWKSVDLTYSPATGRWIGAGPITAGSEISDWLAQAVDGAGNVGVSTNKGRFFEADPLPETLEGFVITPEAGADGFYDEPPTIRLAPEVIKPDTTYEASVNGAPYAAFTNDDGVTPSGDGIHRIELRGSDGSKGEAVVAVDTTVPTVRITSPTDGQRVPIRTATSAPLVPAFSCRDSLSGIASCVATAGVTADGALDDLSAGAKTFTVTAIDLAGNTASVSVEYVVEASADTEGPTIEVTVPHASHELNETVTPVFTCVDAESAVTTCRVDGDVRPDGTLDTSSVGIKYVTFTATDAARQTTTLTRSFDVVYKQIGFFSPVNNLETTNVVKAGSTVPVKFRLTDHDGTVITSTAVVVERRSQAVTCDNEARSDEIEQVLAAGSSELRFDAVSQTFVYNWKTTKSWTGCRVLTLEFDDGRTQEALFEFRK